MGEKIDQLTARLTEKGAETAAFFRSLQPDDWEQQIYTEGTQWQVKQVMAHFVSAERSFKWLFADVVAGGEGSPEGMDIDTFNEAEVARLNDTPPDVLITQFEQARAALVDFMRGLEDADLERTGRHPWFGVEKMEKFVKLVYRHNMIHERDVRRALEKSAS